MNVFQYFQRLCQCDMAEILSFGVKNCHFEMIKIVTP